MKKWPILLCIVLLLTACGPRYETRYELNPPVTGAGLGCIKQCDVKATQCNQQCSQRYEQCSVKAAQQAQQAMPSYLLEYEKRLDLWRDRQWRYERARMFREWRRDLRHADCRGKAGHQRNKQGKHQRCQRSRPLIHPFPRAPHPGARPVKPTLSAVTAEIRRQTCSKSCGCNQQYRQCYSGCGGQVKPKQICVRNCES